MMTFQANGKTYKASVSYRTTESLRPVNPLTANYPVIIEPGYEVFAEVRETELRIGEVKTDGEIDWIVTGTAICFPTDQFEKKVGRHIAAKNAVSFAYMSNVVPKTPEFANAVLSLFPKPRK
jgi:hypothetical protein